MKTSPNRVCFSQSFELFFTSSVSFDGVRVEFRRLLSVNYMTIVTPNEITEARSALAGDPNVFTALKVIEECEGNLEDAFEVLMVESGTEGEGNRLGFGTSLEQLAQKCRNVICQEDFREEFVDGLSRDLLNALVPVVTAQLAMMGNLPAALAIPVVMYVLKRGIKRFCKSADSES